MFYFLTTKDMVFSPDAILRGKRIFDAEFERIVSNLENAKEIGNGFHDLKPFFKYPKRGEIDIIGFRDFSVVGIEIKTNGDNNLYKQIRNFFNYADVEFPEMNPEMYCFNGKVGLYLLERRKGSCR